MLAFLLCIVAFYVVWSADGFYKAFSLAMQQPTPQTYILNVLLRCCLEQGGGIASNACCIVYVCYEFSIANVH